MRNRSGNWPRALSYGRTILPKTHSPSSLLPSWCVSVPRPCIELNRQKPSAATGGQRKVHGERSGGEVRTRVGTVSEGAVAAVSVKNGCLGGAARQVKSLCSPEHSPPSASPDPQDPETLTVHGLGGDGGAVRVAGRGGRGEV